MEKNIIPRAFLLFLLATVLYFCYQIFRPFLVEIAVATILVTVFYPWYEKFVKVFKGRKSIAALALCLLIVLFIIVPIANLIVYIAQKSVDAYTAGISFIDRDNLENMFGLAERFRFLNLEILNIKGLLVDILKNVNEWLVSGATGFIKGTTNFLFSVVIIIFTMFFFFVDGEHMVKRLMRLTPLPNKYDREIFKKFKDVSYSTMASMFVVSIAQAIISGIGFAIVGVPFFFPSVLVAFTSLLPYFGAGIIWVPIAIYLLLTGSVWQGIFLLVWGGAVISTIDNVIRAVIIKDKAQVHPIFVVLSILGGIALFGFWGIVFGPLIISLAVTIFHIYELEFENVLEK